MTNLLLTKPATNSSVTSVIKRMDVRAYTTKIACIQYYCNSCNPIAKGDKGLLYTEKNDFSGADEKAENVKKCPCCGKTIDWTDVYGCSNPVW